MAAKKAAPKVGKVPTKVGSRAQIVNAPSASKVPIRKGK